MKKVLLTFGVLGIITASCIAQETIYQFTLKNDKDSLIHLESFMGKNSLFLLLPNPIPGETIGQIREIQLKNNNQLNIVGFINKHFHSASLPVVQDSSLIMIPNFYLSPVDFESSNLPVSIKWLLDAKNHRSLHTVLPQAGYVFLINEYGRVIYVQPPSQALDSPFLQRMIEIASTSITN